MDINFQNGYIAGIKECARLLDLFMYTKVKYSLCECVTKNELNILINNYIAELNKDNERNIVFK
jgi:hypothetical protein